MPDPPSGTCRQFLRLSLHPLSRFGLTANAEGIKHKSTTNVSHPKRHILFIKLSFHDSAELPRRGVPVQLLSDVVSDFFIVLFPCRSLSS